MSRLVVLQNEFRQNKSSSLSDGLVKSCSRLTGLGDVGSALASKNQVDHRLQELVNHVDVKTILNIQSIRLLQHLENVISSEIVVQQNPNLIQVLQQMLE